MKKKRITSIFLAATSMFLLLTVNIPAFAASDINGHWAEAIIVKWTDAGKISGYEDGTFRPDHQVTRAEFAAILSRISKNRGGSVEEITQFTDVTPEDWFYDDVTGLLEKGVIAGAETFRPNDYISRQDAMTMAGRAFYVQSFDEAAAESFADAGEIDEYARMYVAGFVEAGYIKGYEDNTIRPKNPITRAESLKMLDGLDLVHDKNSLKGIMDRIYEGVTEPLPNTSYQEITDENAEYFLGLKIWTILKRQLLPTR